MGFHNNRTMSLAIETVPNGLELPRVGIMGLRKNSKGSESWCFSNYKVTALEKGT